MVRKKSPEQVITMILAFFCLIILIFMWSGVYADDVADNIINRLGNSNANIVNVNDASVIIDNSVMSVLNSRYVADKDEFIYCMYGTSDEEHIYIDQLKETSYTSNANHLEYQQCKKNSNWLGTIHSHPKETGMIPLCELSGTDIYSFGQTSEPVKAVICGKDKLGFFKIGDVNTPLKYTVN